MKLRYILFSTLVSIFPFIFDGISLLLFCFGFLPLLIISFATGFLFEAKTVGVSRTINFTCMQFLSKPLHFQRVTSEDADFRLDKRLSGSSIIDDALQDVFQFILRDNIENWYHLITNDLEFLFQVRQTFHKITINFSNRIKDVDWLSFLTTRLVENFSSHIQLYRQSTTKLENNKNLSDQSPKNKSQTQDIEKILFDLELFMNSNKYNRRKVCTDSASEKECLKMLSDLLLQLLSPKEELNSSIVQLLSSQILSSYIILPLMNVFSDPDIINQIMIWLCKDLTITRDSFLTVLRSTDNIGELDASKEMLNREIALLRSHDLGGEDADVKQRLSSLLYVKKLVDHRLLKLKEGRDDGSFAALQSYWTNHSQNSKRITLPLDVILRNNVALSFLLDFMNSIGAQAYLFFLLNTEGWKIAAEQQLSRIELEGFSITNEKKNCDQNSRSEANPNKGIYDLQEAALSLYEQYLSEKAAPRLRVDDVAVRRLRHKIKNESPNECWFDEVKACVMVKIQKDDRFMPSFLKTVGYVNMLMELDLLPKDVSKSDDEDSRSLDSSFDPDDDKERDHEVYPSCSQVKSVDVQVPFPILASCNLKATICQKGVIKEGLSSHAVYAVNVTILSGDKVEDSWIVYRRYSDFYDFHIRMEAKFRGVGNALPVFPAKRAFNNMDKLFLERRQFLLNEYLESLLHPEFIAANPGIKTSVFDFFDRGSYEHTKGVLSRKVDSLVNPLVSSVRNATLVVKSTPFTSILKESNQSTNVDSVSLRGVDEEHDNVPLRILLFLMDEIFDLQNRNQWLRKRVFYMLREFLKAMFGDVYNQKIVDSIAVITSPEQVSEGIRVFKNSFWPNGAPAMPRPERDEATRMRTRVSAKMALLSCISDELKHLIGNETTRQGVLRVFDLFQNPVLNRRLVYVLMEGFLDLIFPEQNLQEFFYKLHSNSAKR